MKTDFFYSKTTGLYVSRKPLAIDARTKSASESAGLKIDWDDEGIINNIDFDDSKKLLEELGAGMLTPIQYWKVYKDAEAEGDSDMIQELCSNKYTEWLDRVYDDKNRFIDNPSVTGQYKYEGEKHDTQSPYGRPGWFNPEGNINPNGEPISVELKRERFATSWKYWSPDTSVTKIGCCAPIRGYVTSVGKPSYDLGIPVDARQPKLMLRECRKKPLIPAIDPTILEEAENPDNLISFLTEHGHLFSQSKDTTIYKFRERFFDEVGELALDKDITTAADRLTSILNRSLDYQGFEQFITQSIGSLEDAIKDNKDIVFVMGHKNPDTDTAVSCLFEAYRNHLMEQETIYVPVIQSTRVPDEVTRLIGDISEKILLSDNQLYKRAKETGLARWISVDQNFEPEVQKYFISIIDHHVVCDSTKNRDLPKTLEMLGSTAALITRKYLGMGLTLDRQLAKMLYGAALMDTENRVEHKMTPEDVKLMDYLKEASGVDDDNSFYGELMSYLLNTDDADILFGRDYKEDWGFGFAVAKIKNGFDSEGTLIKSDLVSRLYQLAEENNNEKNLPLTLLKVTDYKDDNETVNKERLYFVFNKATDGFKDTVRDALESIVRFEFTQDNVQVAQDYIDFWGSGLQLSRKKTAPVLEPISKAFNRYFYSPTIMKWVKRDFQKKTSTIGNDCNNDEEGRINYITYDEAKELGNKHNFSMLSLNEYWKVLNDAKGIMDKQMIQTLQGSNFVEFLDTEITDSTTMTDHGTGSRKVNVPEGNPGLIHPDDIDAATGLPRAVRPPNEYGNKELWRYWQPDQENVLFCRSYIFLLDQPCLDGKFHRDDTFPNLGIRPVVELPEEPIVEIEYDKDNLYVSIIEEGDRHDWKWPKKIWD